MSLLLAEKERRRRVKEHEEGPRYDFYGPDCSCPPEGRKSDGSCPLHKRARENQRPPEADWRIWIIKAGRGFGKTEAGAQWVRSKAEAGHKGMRIALVAPIAMEVRKTMIEGPAGLIAVSPPWFMPTFHPSKSEVHWPNGVIGDLYSAEEPDRLRGHNSSYAWSDEIGAWKDPEVLTMLMLGLRIGDNPQAVLTTTPKPHKWLRKLYTAARTVVTTGTTYDNKVNLAPSFIADVEGKYGGTRLGRQELYAEDLEDVEGAFWKTDQLEALRVAEAPETLTRVVVAVDPSVADPARRKGDDEDTAECGIVVVGLGEDEHAYVLADRSLRASPDGWAQAVVDAYDEFLADVVVAEINNGGALVETVLRTKDSHIHYKQLHASRGKENRAEPIAGLYEQGKVHHVGSFPVLENQMCSWVPRMRMPSPDRMDALVWGVHEAMLEGTPLTQGPYPFSDYRG